MYTIIFFLSLVKYAIAIFLFVYTLLHLQKILYENLSSEKLLMFIEIKEAKLGDNNIEGIGLSDFETNH